MKQVHLLDPRLWVVLLVGVMSTPAMALDNGPQNVGCDYTFDGRSMKTDNCFINGSGMNQGIVWLSVKVGGKHYVFKDYSGSELSLKNSAERRNSANKAIWKGSYRESKGQCRPGGIDAAVYSISNGDKICFYFR